MTLMKLLELDNNHANAKEYNKVAQSQIAHKENPMK